jgi:predicted metal-dependent hydrolase
MTVEQRRALLDRWYRAQLRAVIPALIAKWEPVIGVSVPRWSIRRMKTKWGSCNRESGHIWFNVELAKKHPDSLEYIVVHEMTHHRERSHGERFTKLMDEFMHDWRSRRDLLNKTTLASERWPS